MEGTKTARVFAVDRIETYLGRFLVEADSPEEAKRRFDEAMEDDEWFAEYVYRKTDQLVEVEHRPVVPARDIDPQWVDLPREG